MRDFTGLMAEIPTYVGISAKSVSGIFEDSGIEDLKQINHRNEDLLTVMKLNVPSRFRKYMHSTNVLESAISSV